jgi:hypothetical protein
LPTALPPRPRPRLEQKRTVFGIVLNASMLVSALVLTFIVLMREQQYAMGKKGMFADAIVQLTQQVPADRPDDSPAMPRPN